MNKEGYVLLEVMMAIVILVCGTLAVTASFRGALRADRQSREGYQAALTLEGRLLEMEKTGRADLTPVEDAELGPLVWTETAQPAEKGNWTEHHLRVNWGQGSGWLELPTYLSN